MNYFRFLILSVYFVLCASVIDAQGQNSFEKYRARRNKEFNSYREKRKNEFEDYRRKRQKEFDEYRRKRNEEFAKILGQTWESAVSVPEGSKPEERNPLPPLVVDKIEDLPKIKQKPIVYDEVIKLPKPQEQPKPIDPIEETEPQTPATPTVAFSFYGTPVKVRFDKRNLFHLDNVREAKVAEAWIKMSGEKYTNLVHDCLNIRDNMELCDWAYLQMLEKMAEAICGKETNESVLLMAFVYNQSGYKMRLANKDDKLYLLFASESPIVGIRFKGEDGDLLYPYNKRVESLHIQKGSYPNERPMSIVIDRIPKFVLSTTEPSNRKSEIDNDINITITANKNLLDFYSSYPRSSDETDVVAQWAVYANAPMPKHIKDQLYPQLKGALEGLDQLTAVNKILNLIQTGFRYGYDEEIWGEDRAFFPEESLHYAFCDCEDRSILFTRLVRDVVGLSCLLVYYPGHLAAAVEIISSERIGDSIDYNGRKFYLADPTILGKGAPVGCTMETQDNRKAKIFLLE